MYLHTHRIDTLVGNRYKQRKGWIQHFGHETEALFISVDEYHFGISISWMQIHVEERFRETDERGRYLFAHMQLSISVCLCDCVWPIFEPHEIMGKKRYDLDSLWKRAEFREFRALGVLGGGSARSRVDGMDGMRLVASQPHGMLFVSLIIQARDRDRERQENWRNKTRE